MINTIIKTDVEDPKMETPSIRPVTMDTYIGQERIKDNLSVSILAAKKRNEPLDHILFYGAPGLGKTTLSEIISTEMESHIKITSGPAIEKPGDVVAILSNLQEKDILFIDEIHRLPKQVEEILYSAMEDFYVTITIGKDAQVNVIKLDLPHFTLIGATTRAGMLSAPLRDRFGHLFHMEYYTESQLGEIVKQTSQKLGVSISENAAIQIGRVSRGTPRIANNTLKRVRDFAQTYFNNEITEETTLLVLRQLDIRENGLTRQDIALLEILNEGSRAVGLETLAMRLGEDENTIKEVIEPYLIKQGFILKTPRGRIISDLGKTILYPRSA